MILEINLNERKVTLSLKKEDVVIAEKSWEDENSLSDKLLIGIDEFLKENSIKKSEIERVDSFSEDAGLTSERIAQTVANAWNTAKELE